MNQMQSHGARRRAVLSLKTDFAKDRLRRRWYPGFQIRRCPGTKKAYVGANTRKIQP